MNRSLLPLSTTLSCYLRLLPLGLPGIDVFSCLREASCDVWQACGKQPGNNYGTFQAIKHLSANDSIINYVEI